MSAPVDEAHLARIEEWASDHAMRCHKCDGVARVVIPGTTRSLCAACAPAVPGAVLPLASSSADALDLVAEVRRLTAALATVTAERDEARAALATARREGAEEMRERCARRLEARAARLVAAAVDIEAEDGSEDHGRWLESIDSAALIRALPLDAPGGAT